MMTGVGESSGTYKGPAGRGLFYVGPTGEAYNMTPEKLGQKRKGNLQSFLDFPA